MLYLLAKEDFLCMFCNEYWYWQMFICRIIDETFWKLSRRKSDLLTCKTSMFIYPWRQIRNQPLWYRAIFVFLWTLLIVHYACLGFFKCCQQIQPAVNLKYFLFKDRTCSQFIQLCGTEALGHLLMMSEAWSWNDVSAFYILLCWEDCSSIHLESIFVRVFLFLVLQWVFAISPFCIIRTGRRDLHIKQ